MAMSENMNFPPESCPLCGAPEVEAYTPRTVYECGTSDYDQRPGTTNPSAECITKTITRIKELLKGL